MHELDGNKHKLKRASHIEVEVYQQKMEKTEGFSEDDELVLLGEHLIHLVERHTSLRQCPVGFESAVTFDGLPLT